jgi:exocyst complex component 4
LIGDKRFLPAASLLVSSIKTINKPGINQIGAVSELKAYFTSQETVSDICRIFKLTIDHD